MMSQWFEYKDKAIALRKEGLSYREIEQTLLIPRSTLSHWLRRVELSPEQKLRLSQNYGNGLIKARIKAGQWHRAQKELRLKKAQEEAEDVLKQITIDDNIVDLALAMLYLGEGAKTNTTAIGNSDPLIMKFFLTILVNKYGLNTSKMRFDLHLRHDQDPAEMREYWAKELGVPTDSFKYIVADKRTIGRATYPNYRGVCIINCGNVAIQRKLIALYKQFCQKVIERWAVSSFG